MDNANVQPAQVQEHTFEPIHSNRNHINREDDSVTAASVANSTARNSAKYNEKGFSDVTGGVNIHRAEADFAELSKELSRTSNISRRLSRVQSNKQNSKDHALADVEKTAIDGSESSDEPFDLEATLRGSRDEEEEAGIKSKRIGVMWDGLTVSGIGGVKNYVKVRYWRQHGVHVGVKHLTSRVDFP
jgi:ATP-binding cassette subfamily G (WHITE) protein 2 (SNQ2)